MNMNTQGRDNWKGPNSCRLLQQVLKHTLMFLMTAGQVLTVYSNDLMSFLILRLTSFNLPANLVGATIGSQDLFGRILQPDVGLVGTFLGDNAPGIGLEQVFI